MTRIKAGRALVRDLDLVYDRREMVATIAAEGIYIRGKKERQRESMFVSWTAICTRAAKNHAEAEKERRKQARRAGRAA